MNEELKKEIIDILDNVSYWETCPEDYKTRIEAIKQQLIIDGVSNSLAADEYEPYFGWCDVDGCENEGCSGGNAWRKTGYWTVCYKHSDEYRNGLEQPKMKQTAVEREIKRDKKTGYLSQ
jgi:hypothetical protein